ncbi:MAG: hypothetical protein HY584_01000 [Candidatus Omnitrophica bacterium]|nr:hypothetical protein [Candidatus Omnitrophota bacterium]
MKKAITLTMVFCFIFSFPAQAKNVWEMADSPKYGEKAGGMLGRGLLNVATSFVDIPAQTVRGAEEGKPEFLGAVGGFAKGATCTVLRAASGVIDVAGFWVPGFNGLPVSRSYDNCLDFGPKPAEAGYAPSAAVYQGTQAAPSAAAPSEAESAESRLKYVKK